MNRRTAAWLPVCLLLTLLAAALATGQTTAQESAATRNAASPEMAQIATDLRLERKLLSLDLAAYREARALEVRTRDQLTTVTGRLDQALTGSSMSLGTLEGVHMELSSARAASQIAADRVEWQIQRLEDRLRRIGFLEGEAGRPGTPTDPVSGTWQVAIRPQNQAGTWELTLNGTLVSGTYRMSGGGGGGAAAGSFRGTYTDNRLRLERVDATRGFDSVFLGSVNPATGAMSGSWTAQDLASGQPAQGDWSAVRNGAGNERP